MKPDLKLNDCSVTGVYEDSTIFVENVEQTFGVSLSKRDVKKMLNLFKGTQRSQQKEERKAEAIIKALKDIRGFFYKADADKIATVIDGAIDYIKEN